MCEKCNNAPALSVFARGGKADPTKTMDIQNRLAREFKQRFTRIIRNLNQAIIDRDVLAIRPGVVSYSIPDPRAFNFATSADKVEAFMAWFRSMVEKELITAGTTSQLGTGIEEAWTNLYVADTYKRGMIRARYELDKAGYDVPALNTSGVAAALGSAPVHMDRLGLLYSRVFTELKGVTAAMDTQISRTLSMGIANGDNPRLLAKKLRAVIDGSNMGELGMTDSLGRYIPAARRAEMIARTEIVRAHHLATIQEYRNWGVAGITVMAEWNTAGFNVCERCAEMNGRVFTLDEIEYMIPAHPCCRCMVIPAMLNSNKRNRNGRRNNQI